MARSAHQFAIRLFFFRKDRQGGNLDGLL
jgi:hypothetical protein